MKVGFFNCKMKWKLGVLEDLALLPFTLKNIYGFKYLPNMNFVQIKNLKIVLNMKTVLRMKISFVLQIIHVNTVFILVIIALKE